jgi:hypothetical protein
MATNAEALGDLVTLTQNYKLKKEWVDISRTVQKYVAFQVLLKNQKENMVAGTENEWRVKVTSTGSAKSAGMYDQDEKKVADMFEQAEIPWRFLTSNWSIDEKEMLLNRNPERIVNLLLSRRKSAMADLAELFEQQFWAAPETIGTNDMLSIDYYIVKNATEGFNGGRPSGYTDVAGLDPNTYPGWKNYTAQYAAITKDDLIKKWRRAVRFCDFDAPIEFPEAAGGVDFGFYMQYDVLSALEEILEAQNENLGNDIASKDGKVVMRSTPCTWVPYLDDRDDYIRGINWDTVNILTLKDYYMKQSKPITDGAMHSVTTAFIDVGLNLQCLNRRGNFVLSTA